jgi:hypothetical protein
VHLAVDGAGVRRRVSVFVECTIGDDMTAVAAAQFCGEKIICDVGS